MQTQGNNNVFLLSDASTKDNYLKGGHFQVETTQNIKEKMISISSSHGSNLERKSIYRSDNELGLTLCPSQSAESLGRCKNGSLVLQENLKMDDAEVGLSDSLSLHKLADNAPNNTRHKTCYCLNPEYIISQDDHFPMYDINRKIGSILNRKKRIECGQMATRLSRMQAQHDETTSVSHVIKFAPEEHNQLEIQILTGIASKTEFSKSVRTLPTCKDDLTCSSSRPADGSFNCLRSTFAFSNLTELRKDSWNMDHVHCKHFTDAFKQDLCDLSGSSRLFHSEMKGNGETISNCVKSSTIPQKNFKSMSLLRNLWLDDLHFPSQKNASGSRRHSKCGGFVHFQRSDDLGFLHPKLDKVPSRSIHDAEALRIHTTSNSMDNVNGGSQNISNSFRYWLIAKNIGTELSHGDQLNENPTKSEKGKTTALYEMLAMPTILKQQEDSQHSSRSSPSGHGDDGSWSNAHIIVTDKALAAKTATIPIDDFQKEVSLERVASTKPHKEPECPRLIKFQDISPSLVEKKECGDAKTEIVDAHINCLILENAGNINHRESSVSRTESMNVELDSYHVKRPHESNSASIMERSLQAEPCNRWLKRLRHSSSDIQSISSKRSKIEDGPTSGEACSLSSSVINYNDSNSGQQLNDVSRSLPSNAKCLHGASTKELKCWIKRWCHSGPQNTKLIPESSEGKQFPSIAAMALMGKVMKRLRTCEFQKRGFSVIWNAEGL